MRRPLTPATVLLALASFAGASLVHSHVGQEHFGFQRVAVGQDARISAGQRLRVTGVVASGIVVLDDAMVTSPNTFLGVDLVTSTDGARAVTGSDCTLQTAGSTYPTMFFSSDVLPEPGFQTSQRLVFEVPPAQLDDPHLVCKPVELLNWYSTAQDVDLGLDVPAAARLAADNPAGFTAGELTTSVVQR